jgi:hypothetical protein
MSDERRKKLLLGLLAVVLVVFLGFRLAPLLAGGSGFAGPDLKTDGVTTSQVADLDLSRLEAEPRDYDPGRDPFRFYDPPPPKPPGPTAEELAALEAARRAAMKPAEPAPPQPDAGPRPPVIELSYLGSFGPKQRPIAVLTDGDQIYNALEGDVLQGQFVVSNIGLESVDLAYVDFPELPPARLAVGG